MGVNIKKNSKNSKNENVGDRIKIFLKTYSKRIVQFEKEIGVSNGYVNRISRSLPSEKLAIIKKIYPDLNTGWLMTGEGSMLKVPEADVEKIKQSVIQAEALLPLVNANIIDIGLANYFKKEYLKGCYEFEPVLNFINSLPKNTLLTAINNHPYYHSSSKPTYGKYDNVERLKEKVLSLICHYGNDFLIEETGKYAKKYQEIIFAYDFDFLKKLQESNLITPIIDAGLRTVDYPNFLVGKIKSIIQREWENIKLRDAVDTEMAKMFPLIQK